MSTFQHLKLVLLMMKVYTSEEQTTNINSESLYFGSELVKGSESNNYLGDILLMW